MEEHVFIVLPEEEGERCDKYLSNLFPDLSRSFIQKQIEEGNLIINGAAKKANYKIKADDRIVLTIPSLKDPEIIPENIPLDIVYEDDDVAIVNKPQGMVVHPSCGHYSGTLVNALLYHLQGRLSGINGVLRPGIVHRIDKDTSGLLIICKNDKAHNHIAEQLKNHTCNRIYHAICHGVIKEDTLTIDAPLGRDKNDRKKMSIVPDGKRAVTHVRVLERFKDYTYIECKLETGRTHQIRVHLKSKNHPLLGDPVYFNGKENIKCEGQTLHAKTIGFVSPSTGKEFLFDSELPDYFEKILKILRKGN